MSAASPSAFGSRSPRSSAYTGSTTQIEPAPNPTESATNNSIVTLRLRGAPTEGPRIRWAEDVVDNEGLGRKSSKVCCIYHKARAVGESSSEDESNSSSSSSSGGSDSEPDNSTAKMGGKGRRRDHNHHNHVSDPHGRDNCSPDKLRKGKEKTVKKKSPNAYEKMPKSSATRAIK